MLIVSGAKGTLMGDREDKYKAKHNRKQAHLKRGDLELVEHWVTPEDRALMFRFGLISDTKDPEDVKAGFIRLLAHVRKKYPNVT